jgi:CelD/BcsL family acetyltransferase involved in cellulose biosynthesis
MKVSVLKPGDLTDDLVARWAAIQASHTCYESPYFHPTFTQLVARVRSGVEIGLLEEAGEVVGFFPYERGPWGGARPVGGTLSDFQAVIALPEARWTSEELLRGCRLSSWQFHHLLADQSQFSEHHLARKESIYLDLVEGFEAFRAARRKAGSNKVDKVFQNYRRVEREIGPVRFEPLVEEEAIFQWLLVNKSRQYRSTGITDLFQFSWIVQLLTDIWRQPSDDFRGVLSAMYFGDQLAAVHFGMRCRGVLHSWFPAYDRSFAKHSPGLMSTTLLAREFALLGVERIDLGKGDEPYKRHFQSGADLVAEGTVTSSRLTKTFHEGLSVARNWARQHRLTQQLRTPVRWYRHLRDWFLLA